MGVILTMELADIERLKINVSMFSRLLFIWSFSKDMLKILDEFEFRPDQTTFCGLAAIECRKNIS